MSRLGNFKRKPSAHLHPTHTGSPYTAKEVAKAGADDDQVQRLVQVITAKAYVAAHEGHTGIGHRYENANVLKRAAEQLRDMGYSVSFDPGAEGYSGVAFSPYLSIDW